MFTYIIAYLTELPNKAKALCYSTQFRVPAQGALAGISTGMTSFTPGQAQQETHYTWLDKDKVSFDSLSHQPEVYFQLADGKPTGMTYLPADYQLLIANKLDDTNIQPIVSNVVTTTDVEVPVDAPL